MASVQVKRRPITSRSPMTSRIPVHRVPMLRQPVTERVPVTTRRPVGREYLAVCVARKFRCARPGCGCSRIDMPTALYEGIRRLVYKNVNAYCVNGRQEFDDMAQACLHNIWRRLHSFRPSKGQLSTWCWHVCRSVLNGGYGKRKLISQRFDGSGEDGYTNVGVEGEPYRISEQIRDVVKFIEELYPEKRRMLKAMFGNYDEEDFIVPDAVCVASVAKEARASYYDVHSFYRGPVRRIFCKFFGRELPEE